MVTQPVVRDIRKNKDIRKRVKRKRKDMDKKRDKK